MATSNIDVVMRLRGQRSFQRQVAAAGAELQAMGVKGAAAATAFASQSQRLKDFGSTMTRNVTLPVAALTYVAGKVAIDFDKSMRNVNSIAQLSEAQFASLSDEVVALAGPTAQSPTVLADGLYDLVSSGFKANDALHVLEKSAYAATAGLTTTDVSTKAVAAVLNAYRLPASAAGKVSDQLFRTVDRGVISFEELASNIGDVLPFASSLDVGLADVGASIATMTKAGISAPETMTRIKAIMATMLKPGTALKNTLDDLGYASGEAMVKQLGFQGTLEKLAETTGGSKEELAALFPNIRALGGALALTGDNAKAAAADVAGLRDSAGSTQRALGEQSKSLAYQWQKLKAEAEALAIAIGPTLLGAARILLEPIMKLVRAFTELPRGVQKTVVVLLVLAAALGPVSSLLGYMAGGVGRVLVLVAKLAPAVELLNMFMGGTMLAGLGWVGLFVAVAAGLVLAYQKVEWFRNGVDAVVGFIRSNWKTLAAAIVGPIGFAVKFVVDRFGTIKSVAVSVWNAVKRAGKVAIGALRLVFAPLVIAIRAGFALVAKQASFAFGVVKAVGRIAFAALRTGFGVVKAVGGAVWGVIKGKAVPVFNWIKTAAGNIAGWFRTAASGIASVMRGIFEGVKGPIIDILNFVIDRINNLIDAHNALPFAPDIGHISSIEEPISGPSRKPNGGRAIGAGGDFVGGKRATPPRMPRSNAAGAGGTINHRTTIVLDGRVIAESTAEHLERAAARA